METDNQRLLDVRIRELGRWSCFERDVEMNPDSVSARLFAAIAKQDLMSVKTALADVADLRAVNSEGKSLVVAAHEAMLYSAGPAAWDIIGAIVDGGYELSETEAFLVAPLTSQHQQWEPDFLAIADQLEPMFDEHHRDYLAPGTHFFTKWNGITVANFAVLEKGNARSREVSDLQQQLQVKFERAFTPIQEFARKSGFTLILDGRFRSHDEWRRFTKGDYRYRFRAHLFPTANKYEAVALIGLTDEGSGPMQQITELQSLESRWPFQIRSCTRVSLELEFRHPINDTETLIRALRSSFYIQKWNDEEDILRDAIRLRGHRRFRFRIGD